MAGFLQAISRLLPMTYAIDALRDVARSQHVTAALSRNLTIVAIAAAAALMLGAATLRRRTP
jgi:ABC-2 type transport system permease protein